MSDIKNKIKLAKHHNRGMFSMEMVVNKKRGMYEWMILYHDQLLERGSRRIKEDAMTDARAARAYHLKKFHKIVEDGVKKKENSNVNDVRS